MTEVLIPTEISTDVGKGEKTEKSEKLEKTDLPSKVPASSEEAIRKLGHYIVGETLGEGGFSKVKLGIHEKTGEKVALKMLKNKSKLTKPVRKQVERECLAMSKVDHPNVLRMKEVDWDCVYTKKNGKKQNIILVILELATGGELFEFLSYTGFFEESIARTYFHQLMAGVEFCHSKGVVHRDLKPENLLLDDQFTLKLADFGFSNLVCAAHKLMHTECGTPGYMAPEMFRNPKGYDGMKADIWACGVILFIMLAGFPPFQKPSTSDWWFNKLNSNKHALFWQAHSRSAYFSDQTKDFINKILNPDPEKRISIADMKKHAWWKGATITNVALVAELNRRKNTVDQFKSREKERKKKEKGELSSETTRGDDDILGFEGDVHKGLGDEVSSDSLPPCPPKLTFKHQVYVTPTHAAAAMGFGDDLMSDESFGEAPEKKEEAEKLQTLDETITRYTRFNSTATPQKIVERVSDVVRSMKGKLSLKPGYKIKCQINRSVFLVQVFADPKITSQCVVDFRKKTGSAVDFRAHYQDVRAQLVDIVLQPPGKPDTPTAPESPA